VLAEQARVSHVDEILADGRTDFSLTDSSAEPEPLIPPENLARGLTPARAPIRCNGGQQMHRFFRGDDLGTFARGLTRLVSHGADIEC